MFRKLILLSNILILLSIVPVRAQYSFAKVFGGTGDDRPYGIFQLSNGNYILYGYYDSGLGPGVNYVSCIDKFGNLQWEKQSTNQYGNDNRDGFEIEDNSIFITGNNDINGGSPYIIKLKADGTILFDTILRMNGQGEAGGIFKSVNNEARKEIVSIGSGAIFQNNYIIFHKANYNGQQLSYKFINYPTSFFRFKNFFKVKDKAEYLVFGERLVIRLDSMGNQIGAAQSMIEAYQGEDRTISDITQNEDGTFTSLARISSDTLRGYYLRLHNDNGLFEKFITKIAPNDSDYVNTITSTKDRGYFIAGRLFYRVDSTGQLLWCKRSRLPKNGEMVCVKQALDGGFYGCALDFDEETNYNMYAFKTTPEGDINTGLNAFYKQTLKAQIMPNPSAGLFTITGEFKQAEVCVSNLLGQEVLQPQTITAGGTIDGSNLEAGMYVLTISSGDKSYVQKVNITK